MIESAPTGWPVPLVTGYVDRSAANKSLRTFDERVDPSHTALIIIDMQNDYCAPGGASDRRNGQVDRFQQIVPPNKALLEEARRCGAFPVFVQMGFEPYALYNSGADLLMRAKKFGLEAVAIKGTWGHEVVDDLAPLPHEVRVEKHRSSAFQGTDLDLLLRSNGIRSVVISGVVTHGCVYCTTLDSIMADYYTTLCRDCVATTRQDLHDAAMLVMESKLQEKGVVNAEEVIASWQRWRVQQQAPVAVRGHRV